MAGAGARTGIQQLAQRCYWDQRGIKKERANQEMLMKTMTKSGPLRGIERSPDAGGLSSSVLGRIGEQMRSSEPADQDEGQSKAGDEKGQEDHS